MSPQPHRRPDARPAWALVVVALAASGCVSACPRPVIGNESAAVVLLDFSKTYAPYTEGDAAALKQIGETLRQGIQTGWLAQPTKVQWAAFGDHGLSPILPCGPPLVFRQRLTRQAEDSPDMRVTSKIEDFSSWLGGCVKAVVAQSHAAQQHTDISGALTFAVNATKEARQNKLIVIYSDMRDDVPVGRESSSYNVAGTTVVIAWRPGADDMKQPAVVQKRVDAMVDVLKKSRAARVCQMAVQSITAGDVMSCISR